MSLKLIDKINLNHFFLSSGPHTPATSCMYIFYFFNKLDEEKCTSTCVLSVRSYQKRCAKRQCMSGFILASLCVCVCSYNIQIYSHRLGTIII